MKKRVLILIGVLVLLTAVPMALASNLTKDMREKLENIRLASVVYDRNGKVIGNLYFYKRIWIPDKQISKNLKNAVIAIEDSRFYKHNGIDLRGITRAVMQNIKPGGNMQGGSTITQQLAKIALLTHDRTLVRKIQDISYALEIERVYSKQEILELYLNSIYLGHGNVGVEAAARYYFGKSADRLNLEESALIAGIIRSPENLSPIRNLKVATERRNVVLSRMLELGYITTAQHKTAIGRPVRLVKQNESASVAGYFLDYVRRDLLGNHGFTEEQLRLGGYRIYTTLDINIQQTAEQVMTNVPHDLPAAVQPQGALVSLKPETGEILAMVGGRRYVDSQYNRAVLSRRQPGSAIKPFIYATAIQKGYTAATIIDDKPLSIPLVNGTIWTPDNYDHKYRGPITLREGLKHSVNSVAIQLVQQIGIDPVVQQMEEMGIQSLVKEGSNNDLNLAPLSLGGLTQGVTPLELTAAYAPFANGGHSVKPFAVKRIVDRDGVEVKRFQSKRETVMTPQNAYILTMLLKDVVDNGTGQRARLGERPAAGKTGTTSEYTNAWFVGYTPEMVTTIWIGNDRQDQPMVYKNRTIGSGAAAELWGAYMRRALAKQPVREFNEPPGILWAQVDLSSGKAVPDWMSGSNTYREVFAENNVPATAAFKVWQWMMPKKKQEEAVEPLEPIDTETVEVEQVTIGSIPGRTMGPARQQQEDSQSTIAGDEIQKPPTRGISNRGDLLRRSALKDPNVLPSPSLPVSPLPPDWDERQPSEAIDEPSIEEKHRVSKPMENQPTVPENVPAEEESIPITAESGTVIPVIEDEHMNSTEMWR